MFKTLRANSLFMSYKKDIIYFTEICSQMSHKLTRLVMQVYTVTLPAFSRLIPGTVSSSVDLSTSEEVC